jgi:HK97 family phage major capsid protein
VRYKSLRTKKPTSLERTPHVKRLHPTTSRAASACLGCSESSSRHSSCRKRDLTSEEEASYSKINEDLNERAARIEALKADVVREAKIEAATRDLVGQVRTEKAQTFDADVIRSMARGETRGYTFEQRDVVKTSTGAPVPTSFYNQVIEQARLVGPMLETSTTLRTAGGENLQIPSQAGWSTAAITGEGTAISESDPTFNSFITLSAYKYSFLVQLSRELIEDSGVDILAFLAVQTGNALGFKVNNDLTVGSGSSQPNGIVTAAASAVTGTASGPTFTADNLIDLAYSLDGAARRLPGVGWMMNTSSLGVVRKLKDNNGAYIFSPALADGNDRVLSYPVFENPAMASNASATKSVIFGHLPSYYVRMAGGLRLDRSDDYAFNADLVTFRASMRVDGNLPQTSHVKFYKNANS